MLPLLPLLPWLIRVKIMKKIIPPIFLGLIILLSFWSGVSAYQIQDLINAKVEGDVVLGPTKTELFLDPGETITQEITVTNRTGSALNFKVEIEDFKGSHDLDQNIVLMGEEKGPYSLRDWLKPEITEFTLKHGQRIQIPVQISIPAGTEPGGHYGVVFASVQPPAAGTEAEKEKAKGQVAIVSRVGTLFFVRIAGEVEENGYLKEFKTPKNYFEKGPIPFGLLFENNGSVHLAPYGAIEIKNLLGSTVGEMEVDPWFVMPDSSRKREVSWEKGFLFGKYTAVVSLNRGYQDIIDQKSIDFWVIPWKVVLAGMVGLFLIILLFRWIFGHFEVRRKTPASPAP